MTMWYPSLKSKAMNFPHIEIERLDHQTTDQTVLQAYYQLAFQTRAERLPDDPPLTFAEFQTTLQNVPPFVQVHTWLAWERLTAPTVVASGSLVYRETEDNKHLAQLNIVVLPECRRQGLGHSLLAQAAEVAAGAHRRLLIVETSSTVPAGELFMERLGAKLGLHAHVNQLDLTAVDHTLVQSWLTRGEQQSHRFAIGLWIGPYPEAELADIAALHDVMNQAPLDDLDVEDFHMTPVQIREIEQAMLGRGVERWCVYVRELSRGALAGYTELFYSPHRPTILDQGDTGVFPPYRGLGLGRWLKATMLSKVLQERPSARFIRTGNADSNAAMLKINQELGFKPYQSRIAWQVTLDQVQAYLQSREELGAA